MFLEVWATILKRTTRNIELSGKYWTVYQVLLNSRFLLNCATLQFNWPMSSMNCSIRVGHVHIAGQSIEAFSYTLELRLRRDSKYIVRVALAI